MKKIIIIYCSLVAILTSCSNERGSKKFIGFWKNAKSTTDYNAPNFYDLWIIGQIDENNFMLLANNKKTPLVYKKEGDKLIPADNGGSLDIKYDSKTDHLIIFGEEYEKTSGYIKNSEKANEGPHSVGGMEKDDQSFFVDKVLKEN